MKTNIKIVANTHNVKTSNGVKKYLFITILTFFFPLASHAGTFYFDAPKEILNGEEKLVSLRFDTGVDKINAISGTITFNSDVFSIVNIYDGDSAVVLWVERPSIDSKLSSISFSGLTPGGFQGDKSVFSFGIKSKKSGVSSISLKDLVALKNDGSGSPVKITKKESSITVLKELSTETVSISDTILPELFSPIISTSEDVFEGKPFLSFATVDKGVGIDHYEVAFSWMILPKDGPWVIAESPFLIPPGDESKLIFIKAVDRNGNARVVRLISSAYCKVVTMWGIIVVLFLCVLFLFTRRFLRSHY